MSMDTDTPDRLEPWIDDGNVVLSAEGKLFRVHRSILSSYSEVFRDMFACPHSDTVETELIEGCPVVRLHDAATDVQIILKAMYSRGYMHACHEEMPFPVASAFLRLGKKYNIPQLFSEAEARVRPHINPTLPAASRLKGEKETPWPNLCKGVAPSDPYNIQLMNLLRELDLTAYLPLIMFQCVLCSPVQPLVNGHEVDGTIYSLSLPNLRSYILMEDILRRFRVRMSRTLALANSDCTNVRCASRLLELCSEELTELQPFRAWSAKWDECFASCGRSLRSMREAEIKKTWAELPTAFGFGSWEEVKMAVNWDGVPVCHRAL